MQRFRFFALLLVAVFAVLPHVQAQTFGRYVGKVQTEWLDNDSRRMRLLAPFAYVDPKGVTWMAPAGWVIDGASIPVFAWSIIGGPFNGKYRDASVIHDVACDQKVQPWEAVHEAFFWAMMASGVEEWRAKVMYAAVFHFGPRWARTVTVNLPENEVGNAPGEALAKAEPGSDATIIRVRPQAAPSPDAGPGPRRTGVDVKVEPPPKTLTQQDFDNLKARIIEAEESKPAPPKKARTRSFHAPSGGGGGFGGNEAAPSPAPAARPGISLSDIRSFKP